MHALVSNATFYHLSGPRPTTYAAERQCVQTGKLIRHRLVHTVRRPAVKRGGDHFEAILAEYYAMHGFHALNEWISMLFDELMAVAWEALQAHRQP
jgi:hypothetical protein